MAAAPVPSRASRLLNAMPLHMATTCHACGKLLDHPDCTNVHIDEAATYMLHDFCLKPFVDEFEKAFQAVVVADAAPPDVREYIHEVCFNNQEYLRDEFAMLFLEAGKLKNGACSVVLDCPADMDAPRIKAVLQQVVKPQMAFRGFFVVDLTWDAEVLPMASVMQMLHRCEVLDGKGGSPFYGVTGKALLPVNEKVETAARLHLVYTVVLDAIPPNTAEACQRDIIDNIKRGNVQCLLAGQVVHAVAGPLHLSMDTSVRDGVARHLYNAQETNSKDNTWIHCEDADVYGIATKAPENLYYPLRVASGQEMSRFPGMLLMKNIDVAPRAAPAPAPAAAAAAAWVAR